MNEKEQSMKKRNEFDSKDMMLLLAALIIIYLFTSWFGNNGEVFEDYTGQTHTESSQSAATAQVE